MAKSHSRSTPEKRQSSGGGSAGRSMWSGQLRLALVSVPVQLVSAVKTGARLAFHQIDSKSGKRIHYDKVAGEGKVAAADIVKGFEISKGQYVLLTDEDLDSVKIEARRTIDLIQFVDHCEIDPIYFDKPYYVLPDGELAEEAYAVLRDALRATGKMGLGQFVMRGREYVVALKPCGAGLMLETLRFADEVRTAAPLFADVSDEQPNQELLDLAKELIGRKVGKFDPERFHDQYTEALRAMIDAKAKNKAVEIEEEDDTGSRNNVIDLVEALRRSVQDNQPPAPAKAAKAKPAAAGGTGGGQAGRQAGPRRQIAAAGRQPRGPGLYSRHDQPRDPRAALRARRVRRHRRPRPAQAAAGDVPPRHRRAAAGAGQHHRRGARRADPGGVHRPGPPSRDGPRTGRRDHPGGAARPSWPASTTCGRMRMATVAGPSWRPRWRRTRTASTCSTSPPARRCSA